MTEHDAEQTTSEETAEHTTAEETETSTAAEAATDEKDATAAPEAVEASAEAADASEGSDDAEKSGKGKGSRKQRRHPARHELNALLEYATRYPEIGPTVAELAVKLGEEELAKRILRLGVGDEENMEYFFVAGDLARKEGRHDDVLELVLKALKAFAAADDATLEEDDASRLLHLVRLGFAVLMFDIEDVKGRPEWTSGLVDGLVAVESKFATDPFYHSLRAQALWASDADASEALWDKAVELDSTESTWNARGTWYKEAERDLAKAESAYRSGLKANESSPLIMHNLAQVLLDRAEQEDGDVTQTAGRVREADTLLRKALRRVRRHGLRRHIHLTVDRVKKIRPAVEEEVQEATAPSLGDVVRGRVQSITDYGAFLTIPGNHRGLLHKSEIAHDFVRDPRDHVKVGEQFQVKVIECETRDDGKLRIGFSRKAVLPKPEGAAATGGDDTKKRRKPSSNRKPGNNKGRSSKKKGGNNRGDRGPRQHRSENRGLSDDKIATLGELILAKMQEKEDK